MRRVVVTGLGCISPLAYSAEKTWDRLIKGDSGIRSIDAFDTSDLPSKVAGFVRWERIGEGSAGENFDPSNIIPEKDQRKMDHFILYGLAAAVEAVRDAGWETPSEAEKERTGVLVGSGVGGLETICNTSITLHERGARRVNPFFIPACLINLAAGHIAIRYGFKGPNHAAATACSAGAHAIGDAFHLIRNNLADVIIAGGAEGAVCRLGVAGFAAVRALSTHFNDRPSEASRPWDAERDGFVVGEGAGILVLEELEHARRRGVPIYAEVIGYGLSGDAYHITSPASDGDGAYRAMKAALASAAITPQDVDYINAHGTSTPIGDKAELFGVQRLFGEKPKAWMSSTKSSIGHLLGASGAVEAVFCIKALCTGIVPPTLNLRTPPAENTMELVPCVAKERRLAVAMSNSFGFGGTNVSLVFRAFSR
ncbi:MAG: beta-ketoacyl-ACP synthase II [Holosporales bacterium]|jgi:3-oxoacyl-[acyl-carrier-protein] synthase II|nr:beta-ketoacyl-ACP synthase II [Holosporales bacterium]